MNFIALVNANRLWIPEMEEMIEIMHFSMSIFVVNVSRASSLDAVQTSEWGYSKRNQNRLQSRHPQTSLPGHAGGFQEVDVTSQLLKLSCSR
jgi:hypothetical protein